MIKPDPKMKDSGVEWIGEIPEHWDLVKPRFLLKKVKRVPKKSDEVITCFRDGVVTLRKNRREEGFTNSIKEIGYQRVKKGDLVVHEMDGFEGAIGISDSDGKSTPVYTVIEPSNQYVIKFFMYLLREMANTRFIESLSNSIRQRTSDFRWKTWRDLSFPFPPLPEQTRIVAFLDDKTTKIDELITKKERKIELLKEQRKALINQAVTKGLPAEARAKAGLDPTVTMKDSGVEWIGEIPREWEQSKLKFLFSFKGGGTPSKDNLDYWNGSIPWVSPKDMKSRFILSTQDYISEIGLKESSTSIVEQNSLLMVVRSGILRHTIPISINKVNVTLNQDLKSLTPKGNVLIQFFYYFIKGNESNLLLEWSKDGTTVESIEMEFVYNFRFSFPSVDVQNQIVKYLDIETQKIDQILVQESKKIELLKEYRQAIISEVVTGKVDVSNYANN